jgi:hypothetical protein
MRNLFVNEILRCKFMDANVQIFLSESAVLTS